jgi:NADH:ubiquinone oxidoreductase subunit E
MGKYHAMTFVTAVHSIHTSCTACCRLQGAQHIEHALTEKLGIHIGETTADGMFTLGEMECMGACVNAPMIAIAGAFRMGWGRRCRVGWGWGVRFQRVHVCMHSN